MDLGANFTKKYLLAAPNYSCYFAARELGFFISHFSSAF